MNAYTDLQITHATVTITNRDNGSPYSQSRLHNEPKMEGESHDAYDQRTVRSKCSVSRATGNVVIPSHGFHQALIAAAKYDGAKIPGAGTKTWTAKFTTGIMILGDIDLGFRPDDPKKVRIEPILCNADGVRGSGKRVMRYFPVMDEWEATFQIAILDPIITEATFMRFAQIAGMFIGLGRFRPEKGGHNGRFYVSKIVWADKRKPVKK